MVAPLRWLLVILLTTPAIHLRAQHRPESNLPLCATPDLSEDEQRKLSSQAAAALWVKKTSGANLNVITYVPIRPHIIRRSNGTGGMSLDKLANIIANTNRYYLNNNAGIQFYLAGTTPDYIDDDNLYNGFPAFDESSINARDATNALNQYYIHAFTNSSMAGYAYFPNNTVQSTRSFILDEDNEEDMGTRLIPHELGHNFNLIHTFGRQSVGTDELVTRGNGANCLIAGDELCDTPADPYGRQGATTAFQNGCQVYNGTARDAQGLLYQPSVTNIMSYYFACTHDFTQGQYERIQAGLALRQTHSAYSLNYPSTNVSTPGSLAAVLQENNVVLTWQDNATNEIGYFIERSTQPNANFVPIGGTGPNRISYVDTKTTSYTTYYYRIRPANSTANISSVISITTQACNPVYANNCLYGDGLASLTLSGSVLSQNSGCSPSGYNSFTTSTTVTAGQSYTLSGTFLSTNYPEGVTVWADLNRNGVFETEQGERLFQTPTTVFERFTGVITLPKNTTAGPLTIRATLAYDVVPESPCGNYNYGETEDYIVTVNNAAVTQQSSADLSIQFVATPRTPIQNQPITYAVTVVNNGPDDATGVSWQNRLPEGLTFLSGDVGVTAANSVISASNISLSRGNATTFRYQLMPTQAGTFQNAVQITATNQSDPDSQPNSGTGDGQDDMATVDVRTTSAAGAFYASPNPSQIPLPAIASNQPVPDAGKADLSISQMAGNLVAKTGSVISFSLLVSNAGGLTATNVVLRDTLRGLRMVSSPASFTQVALTGTYTVVDFAIQSLAPGALAVVTFTAQIPAGGSLKNTAEVWRVDQSDPDSTPGSQSPSANNLNGEDDICQLALRISS
ncbi:GEVED domain-containing protein [Spirosoma sp. KUDC1026]|uniref:GEVED domain-containing protein n=1 Tax=Spirosoma sp. KUDC1026 TaxID=2745947 RepID=UPI00159BEC2A|nr:GEVED domain-containing protein [Spirosoma sp. KUDC1026]QKZ11857.1 DUF11 domain-containing protein [Spirosoma sp. KUDC1026]